MKKNLLIISYSYPPSNAPAAQRPYALAKYIDKSKYNVSVITCSNPDSSLGFDQNFNPELEGVSLIKIKTKIGSNVSDFRNASMKTGSKKSDLKTYLKKIAKSLFGYFVFPDKGIFWENNVLKYLKDSPELLESADIIFSTSPLFTNHRIGLKIKKQYPDKIWIADIRDFHYIEVNSQNKSFKNSLHKSLEKSVLDKADKIVFISSAMRDVYVNHYSHLANKMNYVYNGYDPADFADINAGKVNDDKLTVFYAGSFYKGQRSPIPLLRLLDKSFDDGLISPKDVIINIAGNFEQELAEEAKQFTAYNCIHFLGNLPRSQVLEMMPKATFLWLIVANKITHYTGVPIKFYEYLAAKRPILNFAPNISEPTKIIGEMNLGESFDTFKFNLDKEYPKFKIEVEKFLNGGYKNPLTTLKVEKFKRDHQAILFQQIFEECIKS